MLEATFEQLVDTALRLEEAEKDSGDEAWFAKRGFIPKKKQPLKKSRPFFPNKKAKNKGANLKN